MLSCPGGRRDSLQRSGVPTLEQGLGPGWIGPTGSRDAPVLRTLLWAGVPKKLASYGLSAVREGRRLTSTGEPPSATLNRLKQVYGLLDSERASNECFRSDRCCYRACPESAGAARVTIPRCGVAGR